MKRIVDDPDRMKLCRKCGAEKPVSEFYTNTRGYPSAVCKVCHKKRVGQDYKAKYAANAAFRLNAIAAAALRYWADVEVNRAKVREHYWSLRPLDEGEYVRICPCHGKVCRLWTRDDTIRCQVSGRPLRRVTVARMPPLSC